MSKTSHHKHRQQASDGGRSNDAPDQEGRPQPAFRPPLRPSRKRLIVAAALLAIWVAFLLTLYVTAVSPEKQKNRSATPFPAPATQPGAIAR